MLLVIVPTIQPVGGAGSGDAGADEMPTTLKTAAESYLRAKSLSRGTRNEYLSTLRKWEKWGGGTPVEQLRRKGIREILACVCEPGVPGARAETARSAH